MSFRCLALPIVKSMQRLAQAMLGPMREFQTCDDGVTWPASTTAPPQFALAAVSAEGLSYATTFEDISSSLQKKFVRFGVWVYNSSGTAMEFATVAIRVETRNT